MIRGTSERCRGIRRRSTASHHDIDGSGNRRSRGAVVSALTEGPWRPEGCERMCELSAGAGWRFPRGGPVGAIPVSKGGTVSRNRSLKKPVDGLVMVTSAGQGERVSGTGVEVGAHAGISMCDSHHSIPSRDVGRYWSLSVVVRRCSSASVTVRRAGVRGRMCSPSFLNSLVHYGCSALRRRLIGPLRRSDGGGTANAAGQGVDTKGGAGC